MIVLFILFAEIFCLPVYGEELPRRWERVLDEILVRAESDRSSFGPKTSQTSESPSSVITTQGTSMQHPRVGDFVRYFAGTGARHFQSAQKRLETYRPMMEAVFEQEGLPRELIWIGLVESGYDPTARSPKNAVGIWQLIPETAQTFGLSVQGRDERTDPLKSTRAAARYLKFLYAKFGDWPLVLAAYNSGERRVQTAIDRVKSTDFWRLVESDLLPRETQSYVPAVLAAQFIGEGRLGEAKSVHDSIDQETRKVVFAPFGVTP